LRGLCSLPLPAPRNGCNILLSGRNICASWHKVLKSTARTFPGAPYAPMIWPTIFSMTLRGIVWSCAQPIRGRPTTISRLSAPVLCGTWPRGALLHASMTHAPKHEKIYSTDLTSAEWEGIKHHRASRWFVSSILSPPGGWSQAVVLEGRPDGGSGQADPAPSAGRACGLPRSGRYGSRWIFRADRSRGGDW
jgi:hypothetical protein